MGAEEWGPNPEVIVYDPQMSLNGYHAGTFNGYRGTIIEINDAKTKYTIELQRQLIEADWEYKFPQFPADTPRLEMYWSHPMGYKNHSSQSQGREATHGRRAYSDQGEDDPRSLARGH